MLNGAGPSVPPVGTSHILYVGAASPVRTRADASGRMRDTEDSFVATQLERLGGSITVTTTPPPSVDDAVRMGDVDCVVCEHTDETDGFAVAEIVEEAAPEVPVVLWTGDVSVATEALRCGVTDVIPVEDGTPPIDVLVDRVHRAIATTRESTRYRELVEHTDGVSSIGGCDSSAFDEEDRALGALSTANATAALDGVERQDDLWWYKRAIETLDEMVFAVDDDGCLQFVSDSLAARLGTSPSELAGEEVSRLFDREVATKFEALFAPAKSIASSGRKFETTLAVPGSSELAVEVELSIPSSDADARSAVGIVRDIPKLTATRDRLTAEQNHFRYLFENLPDPVDEVTFDEDGTPVVHDANPAFERTFGGRDDVVGRPISEVLPADADEQLPPQVSHIAVDSEQNQDETTHSGEFRCRTHEGPRTFLFKRIGFTFGGTPRAFGVYFDVTERRQREQYLTLINRVLRHNLRNDLNVVLGYATELTAALEDPELEAYTSTIADIAHDLTSAADDARTLENVIGRPVDGDATVDLVSAVREVVDEVDSSGTVDLRLPDSAPVFGTSRLRVAIEHLVDNVFEHTHAETPTVRIAVDTVSDEHNWTELRVMDDGPGIPETERALLTDELDATPLEHGSGLGLWLVKTVTESLGGEVAFAPSPLGGAGVVLRLRTAV